MEEILAGFQWARGIFSIRGAIRRILLAINSFLIHYFFLLLTLSLSLSLSEVSLPRGGGWCGEKEREGMNMGDGD